MTTLDCIAFERGFWDSVQFGYVPDYNKNEMKNWTMGYAWGKAGKGCPDSEPETIKEMEAFLNA